MWIIGLILVIIASIAYPPILFIALFLIGWALLNDN